MTFNNRRTAAFWLASALTAAVPCAGTAEFFRLDGFDACIDHPETPACRERLRPRDAPAQGAAAPPAASSPPAGSVPAPAEAPPDAGRKSKKAAAKPARSRDTDSAVE